MKSQNIYFRGQLNIFYTMLKWRTVAPEASAEVGSLYGLIMFVFKFYHVFH